MYKALNKALQYAVYNAPMIITSGLVRFACDKMRGKPDKGGLGNDNK